MPGVKKPVGELSSLATALPTDLVFDIFVTSMTLEQLFKLRAMSTLMLLRVDAHLASLNPIHVLEVVDRLVSKCKIEQAVRLLLHFVARDPNVRTPTVLMNRFILLCHADVFCNKKYADLRAYLTQTFRVKALGEYTKFGLEPVAEKKCVAHIPENTFQHAVLPDGIDALVLKEVSKDPVGPHPGRPNHFPVRKFYEALCLFGYFLYKDGLFESSARIVEHILQRDPDNYTALWLSGVLCHYHRKNFDEGVQQYKKCINANPLFAYVYYSLAVLLADAGFVDHAVELYKKTISIDPHHHYAHVNLSIAFEENNPERHKELLEQYNRIIAIHPTEVSSYRAVAQILLRQQQPPEDPADLAEGEPPLPVRDGPPIACIREAMRTLEATIDIDLQGGGGEPLMDLGYLHLRHRDDIRQAKHYFRKFIEVAENRELAQRVEVLVQQLGMEIIYQGDDSDFGALSDDDEWFEDDYNSEDQDFFDGYGDLSGDDPSGDDPSGGGGAPATD